jgi:CRP-like cAMP-binding protein
MKQGDVGDNFYIILNGSVDVLIDGKKMVTLNKAGTGFGELALIEKESRRMATIQVKKRARFAYLTRSDFELFIKRINQKAIQDNISFLAEFTLLRDMHRTKRQRFFYLLHDMRVETKN